MYAETNMIKLIGIFRYRTSKQTCTQHRRNFQKLKQYASLAITYRPCHKHYKKENPWTPIVTCKLWAKIWVKQLLICCLTLWQTIHPALCRICTIVTGCIMTTNALPNGKVIRNHTTNSFISVILIITITLTVITIIQNSTIIVYKLKNKIWIYTKSLFQSTWRSWRRSKA